MSYPNQKIVLGSKYPLLIIDYRTAVGGYATNAADYNMMKCNITGELNLKLFGSSEYSIGAGKFFTAQNVQFMDYNHFSGNQTIFSGFNINTFQLLPYYTYSTTGPFVEGHLAHNFHGFVFNKFPLIRKLKLDEIVGVSYLYTNSLPMYIEYYGGISKLDVFRIEVVGSYTKETGYMKGIRLGISL